ncbi:MAG: hypothetical protein J6W29_03050 [Neisseriaceae bacterium]|nr:hypothetical protein [Neisseriaceae bacterium]
MHIIIPCLTHFVNPNLLKILKNLAFYTTSFISQNPSSGSLKLPRSVAKNSDNRK